MIQMWSLPSTVTPIVEPITQWFGSGFGHIGSTSNRGACVPAASTIARFCKIHEPAARTNKTVTKVAPIMCVRFIVPSGNGVRYDTRFGFEGTRCVARFLHPDGGWWQRWLPL